jgi:hypothetical protein
MKKKNIVFAVTIVILFSLLLIGVEKTDKEKILQTGKEWQDNYTNYQYEAQYLDSLKFKIGENLRIDIYLGLWCPDSRLNVPNFMRVLDALSKTPITVNYYTVERKPNKEVKYFIEDLKVERVPTFIFYRDGKEIGRIIENPKKNLIEDFLEIVF